MSTRGTSSPCGATRAGEILDPVDEGSSGADKVSVVSSGDEGMSSASSGVEELGSVTSGDEEMGSVSLGDEEGGSVDDGQLCADLPHPPLLELGMGGRATGSLPGRDGGQLVSVGQIESHGQHLLCLLVRLDVAPIAQSNQEFGDIIRAPVLLVGSHSLQPNPHVMETFMRVHPAYGKCMFKAESAIANEVVIAMHLRGDSRHAAY